MKKLLALLFLSVALFAGTGSAKAQAIKINIPATLAGTPNIGTEWTISQQFAVNVEGFWMPYMFKKTEAVFRGFQIEADFRFYLKPKYYYTNDLFDGFYIGPYALGGDFNIGLRRHSDPELDKRYAGWYLSGGVLVGYKFYLSRRLRLDLNLGLGYAHIQYDSFKLGAEHTRPFAKKDTKAWVGPTKLGIHLVYNLFR